LLTGNKQHIIHAWQFTIGLTVCALMHLQRWCCNDMDHFDVSVWAFEKLADKKWGVIGLRYRQGEFLALAVLP